LSATAFLRSLTNLDVRLFGQTMSFWDQSMPTGMFLRSPRCASSIQDPTGIWDLDTFEAASGVDSTSPTPLARFVEYGRWFQESVAPDADSRLVESIERDEDRFALTLEDGSPMRAGRVVVAAGIASFAHVPRQFAGLDPRLASHASAWRTFTPLAGKRVAVIGGGQSALESAALLHEVGADVELLVRAEGIHWLHNASRPTTARALARAVSGPSEIGPPGISMLVETPKAFTAIPRRLQQRLHHRAIRPAGAGWLRDRVEGHVAVSNGVSVRCASSCADAAVLTLDDGTTREVDHVLLATGYRVDISRYSFLGPRLMHNIRRQNGYPVLGAGFESSVPGLHFVGATAALSYGPLLRFVAGTGYASTALTRRIDTQVRHSTAA
jgi:cation diffusion facilitator CzcD-associated flavoprotein CzcO